MTRVTVEIEQPDSQAEQVRRGMGVAPSVLISAENPDPNAETFTELKVTSFGLAQSTAALAELLRQLADGIDGELGGGNDG